MLTPKSRIGVAWVVASSYGGGLVGGDDIDLQITAGDSTRTLLTTQASTKIYRTPGGESRQSLHVIAGENALFVVAPDPLVCFTGATFSQRQNFKLAESASLVLIDWLGSGRVARGERWAFDRYENKIEVSVAKKCIFRDALLLDSIDGSLDGMMRLGRFNSLATLLLIGPAVKDHADALLAWVNCQPAPSYGDDILCAASPVAGGVVVRLAGVATEAVGRWIRDRLAFVPTILGEDPWTRKW